MGGASENVPKLGLPLAPRIPLRGGSAGRLVLVSFVIVAVAKPVAMRYLFHSLRFGYPFTQAAVESIILVPGSMLVYWLTAPVANEPLWDTFVRCRMSVFLVAIFASLVALATPLLYHLAPLSLIGLKKAVQPAITLFIVWVLSLYTVTSRAVLALLVAVAGAVVGVYGLFVLGTIDWDGVIAVLVVAAATCCTSVAFEWLLIHYGHEGRLVHSSQTPLEYEHVLLFVSPIVAFITIIVAVMSGEANGVRKDIAAGSMTSDQCVFIIGVLPVIEIVFQSLYMQLIERTGSLGQNVAMTIKRPLVVVSGMVIFHERINWIFAVGALICFSGSFVYAADTALARTAAEKRGVTPATTPRMKTRKKAGHGDLNNDGGDSSDEADESAALLG